MSTHSEKPPAKTSLRFVKYTLIYILIIPFVNWSFTWAPMWELLPGWAFNPVTIITGLVLVARDFAQREVGHEVLIAMVIALALTALFAGKELAYASGLAFLISEMVDWAMYTFTKYRLSTRVVLSSAIAAPLDTSIFLMGAEKLREAQIAASELQVMAPQFTLPNVTMSIIGKMFGALVIWWFLKQREKRSQN
ncbi:MAG: hypothetical protein ACSHXY_08065 [Alphaproteobacteria bacterium]